MTASSLITVPVPGKAEEQANTTYDALMWALARPGTTQSLVRPGMATIAETLIDRECRVHTDDHDLLPFLMSTGAAIVVANDADHAFIDLGSEDGMRALSVMPTGSHLYPDEGCTVFGAARFGAGQALRLAGPGIETSVDIRVDGLYPALWDMRARRCAYPLGFELFLVDGDRIIGLPRSTKVEVL